MKARACLTLVLGRRKEKSKRKKMQMREKPRGECLQDYPYVRYENGSALHWHSVLMGRREKREARTSKDRQGVSRVGRTKRKSSKVERGGNE